MSNIPHNVDSYLSDGCGRCKLGGTPRCKVHGFNKELKLLRDIVLKCGLNEEIKWGMPCYTSNNKNIAIIAAFKEYCSISFFKGALINDANGILVKPGDHTQSTRLLKFTSCKEITRIQNTIKLFIFEAIDIEKNGTKVKIETKLNDIFPPELEDLFKKQPFFKKAFYALTPGRQRAYLLYFSGAKQSKTIQARIEKYINTILQGKGLND